MAGLLNRLAGFVVRKALNLEKYLDDVDSLSFRVQSGDGWIPEQMEVAGPLRIKSNLLKQKTEKSPVDVPATVDTDEGGHADRIVVRLPSWARDGLRGYLPARLPWRPTDRAASSSSPAKSVLPPVKPPPPLRLPGSREARFAEAEETPIEEASREQIQDRYDEPEKVIVEVHGLDFRLRTYSAEELAELRQLTCEAVLEALVRAAAGSDLKTDTASSSTARAGRGDGDASPRDASSSCARGAGGDSDISKEMISKLHRNLCVRCYDARIHLRLEDKPDERAEFRAQRLDFAALMRPVDPDRAEEVWFGGERLEPTPMQCTLEIRSSDLTASAFARRAPEAPPAEPRRREEKQVPSLPPPEAEGQRTSQRGASRGAPRAPVEDLLLNIVFPMFNAVGIVSIVEGLPQWPEDDSILEASSAQPATTAWRFGAPRGALLSLPRGPGGLRPLFSIINAINASGAACDPCSAATETCQPGEAEARHHARRWSQHRMEVLDPSSSSGDGGVPSSAAVAAGRRTDADRFVSGLCATCATAPGQTLGHEVVGIADQGARLSLSARAALLLLRGNPQALELQRRVLETSGAYLPWQRALCHAFYQIWPCCQVQVAAELAGNVTFELGRASQESDTATSVSQRGGAHRARARMGIDLDDKEPRKPHAESAEEPQLLSASSRQGTSDAERETGVGNPKATSTRRAPGMLASLDHDNEIQIHVVNLGVYFSQAPGPFDWRKSTTVLMETVMVLSRESRRRLLWCNAENFKPPRTPAADHATPRGQTVSASPREQRPGRPEEDVLGPADLAQCVDTFRQLLANKPPVLLTFHSGCFEPEGRAGPKPWSHSRKSSASVSQRWTKVSRRVGRQTSQDSVASGRPSYDQDGADSAVGVHDTATPPGHEALLEPTTSKVVWEWVQLPEQPPRQTFLRCTWLLPVHVACSAGEVQSIVATHAGTPIHGVTVDDVYTDANYPGLAALNVQVVMSGLEVHFEDDDRTGNALVVELQNGFKLDLLPLGKVTSDTETEGGPKLLHVEVKGANAWCSTSTEEVRPVFGLADSLEVSAVYHPRVSLAGDEIVRHRMKIKPRNRRDSDELGFSARTGTTRHSMQSGGTVKEEVQLYQLDARCNSKKFWFDVTPQIISVARLLHEEAVVAVSAFRFSQDMDGGAQGGELPATPALVDTASELPLPTPVEAVCLEGSESGEPEKKNLPTRIELKTSIGTLTLNLCDAISSLIRVRIGVQAAAGVTFVEECGQRDAVAGTLVSAVELTGEFMGQGESVWEPFLEPWCLGAEMQYDLPRGELDIRVLDVQVATGWLDGEEDVNVSPQNSFVNGQISTPIPTLSRSGSALGNPLTSDRVEVLLNKAATAPMPRLRTSMTEDRPSTPTNSDLGRRVDDVRATTLGSELLRGGGGKVDRASPLMINLTPGLLQAVLCFTNQLPETTDTKTDDEEGDLLVGAADEPRFAALNLTGKALDTWFHHGNDIENAKKDAKASLWEADPPEPHLTLGTGRLQLVPLDGNITVPANTAMAVQVQEDPTAVAAAQGAQPRESHSSLSRVSNVFSEEEVPEVVRVSVPEETLDLAARRRSTEAKNTRLSRNKTWPPDGPKEASPAKGPLESDEEQGEDTEADWDDNFNSTIKRAKSMFGSFQPSSSEALDSEESGSSSESEKSEPQARGNRFLQRAATRAWLSNEEPTKTRQNILGERHEAAWPRNDRLPILPLTTGWGVMLNDGPGGGLTNSKRQPDFAVQVLRPEPGRCLLLVAPPLRIFNYTDRCLHLSFMTGNDGKPLLFSPGQCNSATAPAHLLGAEQPVDVRRLALPPSPIGRDIESGETGVTRDQESDCGSIVESNPEAQEEWPLPHNSFCCVPICVDHPSDDRVATFHSAVSLEHKQAMKDLSFRFWSAHASSSDAEPGWSDWIKMGQLPDQEYYLGTCRDATRETLHFRILALREERNKPYPVEILNIIVLPALTVVNASPAVLGVDSWNLDQKDMRKAAKTPMFGTMRWLKRSGSFGISRAVPCDVSQGSALHLYHVNSSAPVGVRLRFSDPDMPVDCRWSDPIYNICASCAGRAQQVDMQVVGMSTPTMQVTCVDYVVGVTCPFWLINPSLQNVMVGRRNEEPFPSVRGIYMLDGALSGIHLYLHDKSKDMMGIGANRSRGMQSPDSCGGYSLYSAHDYDSDLEVGTSIREEGHLEVVTQDSIAEECDDDNNSQGSAGSSRVHTLDTTRSWTGRGSMGMNMMNSASSMVQASLNDKARLPIPVTSTAMSGRLGKHEFTVLREPLPSPFDGLCAPTTCFRLIPQLMVTNDTRYRLHVRRSGTQEVVVVEPDKSLPYWAAARGRRRCIQLQPVDGMEAPTLDAWSGEIHCEPLAGGRTALAMRMPRPGRSTVPKGPSTRTQRSTTEADRATMHPYAHSADDTDHAPLVLSVQISDAMEGIISVTVSEKPCWVVACMAKAIRFIAVSTDAPPDTLQASPLSWSHMLSSNLSVRKVGQHRNAGQLVSGAGDLVKGAGYLVASGAQTAASATQTVRSTGEAALKGTGALVTGLVQDVAGKAASAALPQQTNETVGRGLAAGAAVVRDAGHAVGEASGTLSSAFTQVASGALGTATGALGTATGALGSATGAVTHVASTATGAVTSVAGRGRAGFRNFAPLAANIVDRFSPNALERVASKDNVDKIRCFGGRYARHSPISVGWYQPFRSVSEGDAATAELPTLVVVLWWAVDFRASFGRGGESRGSPAPRSKDGTSTWTASASSASLGTMAPERAGTVAATPSILSRRSDSSLGFVHTPSDIGDEDDQTKAVPVSINLQRVTPLVVLRAVPRPDGQGRKQLAVMIIIRPRAKVLMQAHAKLLAARSERLDAQTPSQRENAKKLAEEWLALSQSSPELLEVTDVELDQLADMEVEWACGECGHIHTQTGSREPPRTCSRCSADLLTESTAQEEVADASYASDAKETLYVGIDRARFLKSAGLEPGVQHYVVCRIFDRPSSSFRTYSADWAGPEEIRWEEEGTLHDWAVGEDLEFELFCHREDFESNAILVPELLGKAVLRASELRSTQLQKELAFEGTDGSLLQGAVLEVSVERSGALSDDEEEAEARSTSSLASRATVRLSRVLVSVVSPKARREMFLGEMTGMKFVARRTRGHEKGWLTVAGCRVDCQNRVDQHREKVGWIQRARRALFQPRILRTLAKTPAVFASVGILRREDKTDRTSSMMIGDLAPALSVHWDRPATDLYGNTLCVKSIRIDVNRHWEVTIDNAVAQALLTLHHEVTKAIFNSSNQRNADQAQLQFSRITADASDSFVDRFEPPDSQMVVQAEKAQISMFEITVWASVDLSCLPTASMPASLMFLLKLMCITDTFNVEGNSMVFREWKQGAMRQSIRQLCTLFRIYYQGSVLFFVTRTLGSLNLLKALQVPLMMSRVVTEGIATLVDIADTTLLTLADQEGALDEKRSKNDHVQSLQEGLEVAATRLWDGFAGIADGLAQPTRQYKAKGCLGVPRGICRGLLSCVVKPVSGLLQALRAIFQGISAAFGGNIRKDPSRHVSRRKAVRMKKDSQTSSKKRSNSHHKATIREKGKAPKEIISSKLQDLNNNVVDGFNTSLESTANFLKPHPYYHSMPFLRMPRLLFGPEASLRPWCAWHAELLSLLGHSSMLDLRAAWRLAGGAPSDSFHLVMLATDTGLMLVNLGRSTMAPRSTHSASRWRAHSNSLENLDFSALQKAQKASEIAEYMQRTSERLRKRQQKGRDSAELLLSRAGVLRRASEHSAERADTPGKPIEPKLPGMTNWDVNRNNLVATLVVRPGAFVNKTRRILTGKIEQRTWCCRRRRLSAGGTSTDRPALQTDSNGLPLPGVLGIWGWNELDQIRVEGQSPPVQHTASQPTSSSQARSQFQSQFQPARRHRSSAQMNAPPPTDESPSSPGGLPFWGSALMRFGPRDTTLSRNTLSPATRESQTLPQGKRLTTGTTATMTTRDTISQETTNPGLHRSGTHLFAHRIRRTLSSLASPLGGSLERQASYVVQDPAFALGVPQVLVALELGGEYSSWPLAGAQLPADEIKAVEQEINLAIQEVRGVLL